MFGIFFSKYLLFVYNYLFKACWALSYLTDGTDDNIQLANKENVMPLLIDFINSGQNSLISPALRTAGNFATGSDELTSVCFCLNLSKNISIRLLLIVEF